MNNGNLLGSLLGATGAGSAAAKSTSPKTRVDSTEKFQTAFEQARPEVAARKPAARKEVVRQSPEPRPEAIKSKPRAEQIGKAAETNNQKPHTTAENSEKQPATMSSRPQSVNEADGSGPNDETVVTGVVENNKTDKLPDDVPVMVDPVTLIDGSGLVTTNAAKTLTLQVDGEISTDSEVSPLLTDASLTESEALLKQDEVITQIAPGLEPALPATLLPGVETEAEDLAAIGVDIKTVGLNSLNPSAQSPVATTNQTLASVGLSLADDAPLPAIAANEPSLETGVLDEGENGDMTNLADNPDFALLNIKAGLNKAAETNLTSLDKLATATEPAKPVAAAVSVLESITRPLESQSPAARAFVVQTGVPVTVGSPQWSQAVGDKVLWLAAQNVSAAEIRLDPPELGPMQVKVSVTQDQASVTFTSHNPVVRDALDQQLNRLREMFAEQGLNLVNVDVSDKSFAQQQRDQDESGKSRSHAEIDDEEPMPVAVTSAASIRLVDHYA